MELSGTFDFPNLPTAVKLNAAPVVHTSFETFSSFEASGLGGAVSVLGNSMATSSNYLGRSALLSVDDLISAEQRHRAEKTVGPQKPVAVTVNDFFEESSVVLAPQREATLEPFNSFDIFVDDPPSIAVSLPSQQQPPDYTNDAAAAAGTATPGDDEPTFECFTHKKVRKLRYLTVDDCGRHVCSDDATCKAAAARPGEKHRKGHRGGRRQHERDAAAAEEIEKASAQQVLTQQQQQQQQQQEQPQAPPLPPATIPTVAPRAQHMVMCFVHGKVRSARNMQYTGKQWVCLPQSQCQLRTDTPLQPGDEGHSSFYPPPGLDSHVDVFAAPRLLPQQFQQHAVPPAVFAPPTLPIYPTIQQQQQLAFLRNPQPFFVAQQPTDAYLPMVMPQQQHPLQLPPNPNFFVHQQHPASMMPPSPLLMPQSSSPAVPQFVQYNPAAAALPGPQMSAYPSPQMFWMIPK